jgi:two-component system, sensor histidine kinase PdtaS
MKYAFAEQANGIINIEITKDEKLKKHKLLYVDNGKGFDFNQIETKGLGIEITKGLIDQLNATTETKQSRGFEIIICFT